jgi:hypothetical protein
MKCAAQFVSAAPARIMYRSRSMNRSILRMNGSKLLLKLSITAAALLAALGPFGTWTMPFADRLVNWTIFAFGGYLCFRSVIAADGALATQTGLSRWGAISAPCLLAAMHATHFVARTITGATWSSLTARDLSTFYLQVLIIGSTVTLIQLLVRRTEPAEIIGPAALVDEPALHQPVVAETLVPASSTLIELHFLISALIFYA